MTGRVSRRGFVAATTAASAAATLPAFQASASSSSSTAVATVVRVSHATDDPGHLRIGVRVSLRSPTFSRDGLVLTIPHVPFGLSASDMRDTITKGVRTTLASRFPDLQGGVDIQVFGGVLG